MKPQPRTEAFNVLGQSLEALIASLLNDRNVRLRPKYPDLPFGEDVPYVAWLRERFRIFVDWLRATYGQPLGLGDIDADVLRAFLRYLQEERKKRWRVNGGWQERPLAPSTVRAFYNALRILFRFGEEEGWAPNPMKRLKPPALPQPLLPTPDDTTISRLLNLWPQQTFLGARNHAITVLFLGSGVRLSELASLQLPDDFDWTAGRIRIWGKGRRQEWVPIDGDVVKVLWQWSTLRGRVAGPEGALFVGRDGQPLSKSAIQSIFKRAKRALGLRGQRAMSPHALRRGYARLAARQGMSVFQLQDILRHRDIRTTRGYVRFNEDDLLQAQRRASVLRGFLKRRS